jgi:hypothetical protein
VRPDFQNPGAVLPLHVTNFAGGMKRVAFRMRDMRVCRYELEIPDGHVDP